MLLSVFDASRRSVIEYRLAPKMQLPFITHMGLTAEAFSGGAAHAWTDKRALEALDTLSMLFDGPFPVGRAFFRKGPLPFQAGEGFIVGKGLSRTSLSTLRRCALRTGAFSQVTPAHAAGDRIELLRCAPPALLSPGSAGAYVFAMQDALSALFHLRGAISGIFDERTLNALHAYQRAHRLPRRDVIYADELYALTALSAKLPRVPVVHGFFP